MKSWYITGPNQLIMEDVAEPELKPGYALVEVLTAQGSVTEAGMLTLEGDTHGLKEKLDAAGKASVPGHECCARVVAVNPGSAFHVGDRVTTLVMIPCGQCEACKIGNYHACKKQELLGVTLDGIFSERALLPERGLMLVPEKLTNCEAANLQPLSDCVAGFDSVSFVPGMKVAIFGAGCLGMNMLQIAKAAGAETMIVDIKEENLALAGKLGADHLINGKQVDAVEEICRLTNGMGADIVFDCAGGNPKRGLAGLIVLNQAAKVVKAEGELMIMAHYGPSVEFPIGELRGKGKKLVMPRYATLAHLQKAAELIENGQVQIEPLVTQRFDGIESVPQMFEVTGNKGNSKTINPAQVNIQK